jgi:DNA mismatch endonuclease (patch repair protein)
MTDVLTPAQRKLNMSRIRGKDTSPEIRIRKLLFSKCIRGYRVNYKLIGKPDIVFVKKKVAIFIDGCFWHKCPIHFQEPSTRKEFWLEKINRNVERDNLINLKLKEAGWEVIRIWEHKVREDPELVVREIIARLNSLNKSSSKTL